MKTFIKKTLVVMIAIIILYMIIGAPIEIIINTGVAV